MGKPFGQYMVRCIFQKATENASCAKIDRSAEFGVKKTLISDGPTQFWNETIRRVYKRFKLHITLLLHTVLGIWEL